MGRAPTEVGRAYAWGWVAHVVADAEMHVLVNRAAGTLLHGSPDEPATYAESVATHARVEFGVDAVRAARDEAFAGYRLSPVFDGNDIGFLHDAFGATYALDIPADELLGAHRTATRLQRPIFRLAAMGRHHLGRSFAVRDGGVYALYLPTQLASGMFARESAVHGFTHSVKPADWLDEAVAEWVRGFPARFAELAAAGIDQLPNWNLDTGEVEDPANRYPLTTKTRQELEERRRGPAG